MSSTFVEKNKYVMLALGVIAISILLSLILTYDALQIKAIGVLVAALILWISNTLPMSITTLLLIFILPSLGLMEYDEVIANFGTSTALFITASSGITVAISNSNIPYIITEKVFGKMCKHPVGLIFSFGISITLFSGFISSLAVCSLFTALLTTALKNLRLNDKTSNFTKALMLSVPACSGIGGFVSPAGTPANILVLEILNEKGIEITFGKWCSIGLPICMLATIIFLTFLVIIFKPEKVEFEQALVEKKITREDRIILITVIMVIIGWFASGFVSNLNITFVAILGLTILFIPSAKVLSYEQFSKGVNWDLVFTMGSVSVLMTAIANTGLISKITSTFAPFLLNANIYILVLGLSILICIIRAFIPTTTAVIALLLPMLVDISIVSNVSCGVLLLIVSFWAAAAMLLVYTEPIYLISYKEGYYKQSDLLKVGLPANIVIAAICPFLIYLLF